jgi:hypothetical protein
MRSSTPQRSSVVVRSGEGDELMIGASLLALDIALMKTDYRWRVVVVAIRAISNSVV